MSRKTLAAVGAASLLAITACGGPAAEQASQEEAGSSASAGGQHQLSVAMVTSSCLGFFPVYVAQEQGFFEENGVQVDIEVVNGSSAVLQAMLSGQVDLGTPGSIPVVLANSRGEDVQYVANVNPGGNFALVTPEDSGISDASQLEGKTIGVATADGGEVSFLETILREAGLEEGSYEIMTVGEGGQAVAGFSRGDIDAYSASIDGVATLEQAGQPLQDISGNATNYLFGNGVAASSELIADQPEAIEAFGRAYRQATEHGLENPDDVVAACGQYQPQEVEDPEYATALLEASRKTVTSPDGDDFGYSNPEYWQQLIDDAVSSGEIEEGAVEADSLYTNEFVEGFNR
ncbi:ABC transporter substrate-binding protein [Citricoccus sp. NPDC055426]|uniref:ABC transporter substrate-binding protein n=1 Tax=Citricoccus sp. NPDC055426 TaxID=3155536 RepID=UPI00343C0AC2